MSIHRKLGLAAFAAGCAFLIASTFSEPALAQASSGGVEEIIVTAEKQEANVQSVPLSVTPISGADIERLHIQNAQDLNGTVPNLQITKNSGVGTAAGVVIRGIGEVNNPTPYAGKEVSIVVDGVEQGTNQLGLTDQYDLERIEVLSGPQGTLFGANTTGGVINIVTRQPTGEYGAYGIVTMGNYNTRNIQAAVNFPLTDDLAAKISFSHRGNDGFYTNLYNGQNLGGLDSNIGRLYLKWSPTDDFDVTLISQMQTIAIGDTYLQNLAMPGEVFYRPDTRANFKIYDDIPGDNHITTSSHTLTMHLRSGVGDLTSITNYQHYRITGYLDVDGINCYCLDQFGADKGWQASEELRDAFHIGQDIDALVGLFAQTWVDKGDGISVVPFASPNLVTRGLTSERSWNLSAFTQNYWNITDRLRLQAGFRLSWDHVSLSEAALNYFQPAGTSALLLRRNIDGATLLPYTPGNEPNSGSKSWTNWGAKLGLDYQVTDDAMLYGYYARGFKSGGFNGRVTVANAIGPFDPEFVNTYEAGFKTQWFDNRVRLNGSLFLNKWKDMQVQQSNYTGPTIASVILNAGRATTKGFELQTEWVPVDSLVLSANVGYLNSRYDEFLSSNNPICPPPPAAQPAGCAVSYAGRSLPYAPNWTYMLEGQYTFDVLTGESTADLQYTFTGTRWGNYTQAPSEHLKSVGLINANISWGPKGGNWSLVFWGRNLANKTYISTALDVPPLFTEATLGNPREWGVDLKFKF